MPYRVSVTVSAAATAVLAACLQPTEHVSSEQIRTGGVAMVTTVTANGTAGAHVQTVLRVGGGDSNSFIHLERGDRLVAEADGVERMMQGSDGAYDARFSADQGDTEFRVRLERDDDEPASENVGRLPEPFEITSGFGRAPVSRKDALEIVWEPSGSADHMLIEIEETSFVGGCLNFERAPDVVGDPGRFVMPPGFFEVKRAGDITPRCGVIVRLTRWRAGHTDPALDGESRFDLQQVRQVGFVSGP